MRQRSNHPRTPRQPGARRRITASTVALAATLGLLLPAAGEAATTIGATGTVQIPLGDPFVAVGQSFTAPTTGDDVLHTLRIDGLGRPDGLPFRVAIQAFDPQRSVPSGPVLYESPPLESSTQVRAYTAYPNLTLTPGKQYAFSVPVAPGGTFLLSNAVYAGGSVQYGFSDGGWGHSSTQHLGFRADFDTGRRASVVAVSCPPAAIGVAATCTAKVTDGAGGPTPTGDVHFAAPGSTFAPASCTLADGACSVSHTPIAPGARTVTVLYDGDAQQLEVIGTTAFAPLKRTTATSVQCPGPAILGEPTTCTATVTDTDPGTSTTPTGTVALTTSGTGLLNPSPCALVAGVCAFAFTPGSGAGEEHRLTATYADSSPHDSSTGTSDVPIVARPVVSGAGSEVTWTEGDNVPGVPVAVAPNASASDEDSATLASATVAIGTAFSSGEDVLAFSPSPATGNVVADYAATTGILTLTSDGATATLAQWTAALRAVTYTNRSATPSTADRTIAILVSDGENQSRPASSVVRITAIDQHPTLTASAGAAQLVEGDNVAATPVPVDAGLVVSDPDEGNDRCSARITAGHADAEDLLAYDGDLTIGGETLDPRFDAPTGTLTLGTAALTAAQWQAVLRDVTYANTSERPDATPRTVTLSCQGTGLADATTRTIEVTPTDDTPVVTTSAGTTTFTTADGVPGNPVAIDPDLRLSDADDETLASATVQIADGRETAHDRLLLDVDPATMGAVRARWNAGAGVLELTSAPAATVLEWQAALRSVRFASDAVVPGVHDRVLTFAVSDGEQTSAEADRRIAIDPVAQTPILTPPPLPLPPVAAAPTPVPKTPRAKPDPTPKPAGPTLAGSAGLRATTALRVPASGRLRVPCRVVTRSATRCTVDLFATDPRRPTAKRGGTRTGVRGIRIGRGSVRSTRRGRLRLSVPVRLNAQGRSLLRRHPAGVRATVRVRATFAGYSHPRRTTTTLWLRHPR